MATTIVVGVRSTLIEQLAGLFDADVTKVEYQWKSGLAQRERVFTRNATFTLASASMRAGRNFRDEVGTFELVVLVEGVAMTAEQTADRALEIGLLCEEFIADRKNNELGVTGMQTLTTEGAGSLKEMWNDNGTLAELSYTVRYTARLT